MKALVTNCTRNQGLVTMRSLAAAGWEAYGADDRVPRAGLHARCARAAYALLPAEGDARLPGSLLALVERLRPDVMIPTGALAATVDHAQALRRYCAVLVPAPEAFRSCLDKRLLGALCTRLGVPAASGLEVEEAARRLRAGEVTQVVVKPALDVGAGADVHFLSDPARIAPVFADVERRRGGAVACEFVPGPVDAQRALHLLFDARTRLVAAFALRKQRQWPPGRGVTVAAESVHEPGLIQTVLPLFEALRWQGAADVELKIDARDGTARVLEINPRFSGAMAFAVACGVDLPLLYARAARGEALPLADPCGYAAGRRYVDTSRWLRAVWRSRGQRQIWAQALREWRGRVPGPAGGDLPARLVKLAVSVPALSRRG